MTIRFLQYMMYVCAMMRCMKDGVSFCVRTCVEDHSENVKSCCGHLHHACMRQWNRRHELPIPKPPKSDSLSFLLKAVVEHSTAARRLQEKLRGALLVEIFLVVVEKGARSAVGGKARRANNTSEFALGRTKKAIMAHPLQVYDDPVDKVNAIPMFSKNGTALSESERERIAQKRGVCIRCGIKTMDVKFLKQKPLTSDRVFKGICIRCNPDRVPQEIYRAWEEKFRPVSKKLSPVGKLRAAARATAFAVTHSPERQTADQNRSLLSSSRQVGGGPSQVGGGTEASSAHIIASNGTRPRSL